MKNRTLLNLFLLGFTVLSCPSLSHAQATDPGRCFGPGCTPATEPRLATSAVMTADPGKCRGHGCKDLPGPSLRAASVVSAAVSGEERHHDIPSGLVHAAGPQTFDSGLTDCNIPFEQLPSMAPSCIAEPTEQGRRCEAYSRSQF